MILYDAVYITLCLYYKGFEENFHRTTRIGILSGSLVQNNFLVWVHKTNQITDSILYHGGFKKDVSLLEEAVVIKDAAHFINQEKPDEISKHI